MHQHKTARSVCIFYLALCKTALPEQRCLLVARCTGDRNTFSQRTQICITINMAARLYLRKHGSGDSEIIQYFLIPAQRMNIKQHRPGCICIICHMYFSSGQIPDQPCINRSKQQISGVCFLSCIFDMIEDPCNLGSGKIRIRQKPCLFRDIGRKRRLFFL